MVLARLRAALVCACVTVLLAARGYSPVVEAKPSSAHPYLSEHRSLGRLSAPTGSIYWGAHIGDQLTGDQPPWDMSAVGKLERMLGKSMSLVHFMAPFSHCSSSGCSYYRFPAEEMQRIRNHGSIPFFSWSSQSIPSQVNEPDFQLRDLIDGRYDDFVRQWAREAKRWDHPFFLRFNWEMNGDWFPWADGANGNHSGEYVTAWRHVHDIFSEVGATDATWVWCPNVDFGNSLEDLDAVYPGDSYVNWTCLDGYNSGTNPGKDDHWRSFDELYGRTYKEITQRIAPGKPMAIGEIGSSEQGGSKARWIDELLDALPARYPRIRALLWLDKYEGELDWPIETSPSAANAFAAGIDDPVYAGARFGSYSVSGPIRPPAR